MAITRSRVDLASAMSPDSADATLLHYLLETVANSPDTDIVDDAAVQLYFAQTQAQTGLNLLWCPEIVRTLEEREALDRRKSHKSFVSRTLGNLRLAGMRHQPNTRQLSVGVRHLPPIQDPKVRRRLQTAAAR